MILELAHLVKPFFLGTMLGFQQIEVFFLQCMKPFLMAVHSLRSSFYWSAIFQITLILIIIFLRCTSWLFVGIAFDGAQFQPNFPFFAKWNKSFQRWLINRTFGKVPTTSFWPGHERPMFPHRTRLTIWILTILFVIIPYPYDDLDEFWKFMLKIFLDLNLIYQLYFGIYFLVIL